MFYIDLILIIFNVYLLYDTQTKIGGSKYEWKNDDYIVGSYMVYFDILMIIFRIIRTLTRELFSRR